MGLYSVPWTRAFTLQLGLPRALLAATGQEISPLTSTLMMGGCGRRQEAALAPNHPWSCKQLRSWERGPVELWVRKEWIPMTVVKVRSSRGLSLPLIFPWPLLFKSQSPTVFFTSPESRQFLSPGPPVVSNQHFCGSLRN